MKKQLLLFGLGVGFLALGQNTLAQTADITSWIRQVDEKGSLYTSGNSTPAAMSADANVQLVEYNSSDVYISSSGIPSYAIGPFPDGNPATPGQIDYIFRIPRSPQEETGTKTEPGLGQIGVWINGVPVYNYSDGMSYNNQGVWNRDAVVMENDGFDCSKGHPSPNMSNISNSYYHHHQCPLTFDAALANVKSDICDTYASEALFTPDSTQHSPVLGYSFDGFPIYGPYGYANADGTGGIKLIKSSYKQRNITQRHTLADGTMLQPSQYGPDVDTSYPLGSYKEDYEFDTAYGDLDVYNGRFAVTPEYPDGIYCYYATIDEDWNTAYPYVIGEAYYGKVATDNFPAGNAGGTQVNKPTSGLTEYTGETPDGILTVEQHKISVYPNPAVNYVNVYNEHHGESRFEIMDLSGKILHEQYIRFGINRVDTRLLQRGVYLIRITNYDGSFTQKLMLN